MAKLCNTYGIQQEWAEAADRGAEFIKKYCIDEKDGRMYFTVTRDGKPLRKRRYFFSESFLVVGFAEHYLLRAQSTGDKELLEKALNILRWHLELGWDEENGGIYYFRDVYGRPCEQLEHDMKLWWVHNEALIATLLASNLTGDTYFDEWYEKIA